jgi:hypothetical protein
MSRDNDQSTIAYYYSNEHGKYASAIFNVASFVRQYLYPLTQENGHSIAVVENFLDAYGFVLQEQPSENRQRELKEARHVFGDDLFGPEEIAQALDIHLFAQEIPALPSREQMEWAKQHKMRLVLFVPAEDGGLTQQHLQRKTGKINPHGDSFKSGPFSTRPDVIDSAYWGFVSNGKEVLLPKELNYVKATAAIRDILKEWGVLDSKAWQECGDYTLKQIEENLSQLIMSLGNKDKEIGSLVRQLLSLKVNDKYRLKGLASIYDSIILNKIKGLPMDDLFKHRELVQDNSNQNVYFLSLLSPDNTIGISLDARAWQKSRKLPILIRPEDLKIPHEQLS